MELIIIVMLHCRSDEVIYDVTGFVTYAHTLRVTLNMNSSEVRSWQKALIYNKPYHIKSQCHTTLDFVTQPATTALSRHVLCVLYFTVM